ncbi:hypothetical protein FGG08_000456 [Glutinoglossum americanum]|uniref:Uncharacterized protein n=1 Tax=Glutinoglossum americanum TaxID=1670608 RepID=A0A9P8ICX0_9PEZI|nr:hypothetical protein FGG08_000456 [Glutinoglossum americanum]
MNQYIFYCDSVAPQTITLSFDNPKTGVLVTPSGWSSGPPKPSHPPSASSPSLTSGSPNPPSQISTSSHTATPSPIPVTKTLSSGIIAAISLAAVAIIAVLSATLFWFCIRPWLKRRKGQPAQQITHIIVQENNNFPWGPDSIAAKAPSRHSIPYPESRSELPAHSPHEFSDDKRPLDIGSDEESNMDTIGETHSRGPRDSDISPLSPYLEPSSTHSMISGPPSPPMDRGGAVSPVSLPGADSARRPTVFSFLTPGNATARQLDVDDDDDDDDDGEDDGGQLGGHLELEGSPRFHTRGSMRRKRDSNPKELDSKRNSTPKESDSKRASGLQEQPPTHREEDEEAER